MDRTKGIVRVSIKGIITNFFLVVFKAIVGIIANSISIILDAVNNLTDALSSLITIVGIKLASKKPDKKHPYGHGRIEYLTSLVIAIIILAAGATAMLESIKKIIHPVDANYEVYAFVIIIVAIVVKILLGLHFKKKGNELNSDSLKASGSDALMDSILSISTLAAMIIAVSAGYSTEGYFGCLISVFILKAGIDIIRETLSLIIGERIDGELVDKIKEICNAEEGVRGTYDVIVHNYGPEKRIGGLHVEVSDSMTAREIHMLTERLAIKLNQQLGLIMTIGIYASNESNPKVMEMKAQASKFAYEDCNVIQLHGFYVDEERKICIFDLIYKFCEDDVTSSKNAISSKLHDIYPDYNFMINIDTDYSESKD